MNNFSRNLTANKEDSLEMLLSSSALSPRMKHLVNDTTSAATRNFQFNQYGI
jgi:hypothetical protein